MKAEERRERKCSTKKKGILYRGAVKRRTVGWKKCAAYDNHVETGVKKYFNIGKLRFVRQDKRRTCVPHLHDVSR